MTPKSCSTMRCMWILFLYDHNAYIILLVVSHKTINIICPRRSSIIMRTHCNLVHIPITQSHRKNRVAKMLRLPQLVFNIMCNNLNSSCSHIAYRNCAHAWYDVWCTLQPSRTIFWVLYILFTFSCYAVMMVITWTQERISRLHKFSNNKRALRLQPQKRFEGHQYLVVE